MKDDAQKINKITDFIHAAFCIDGETKFIKTIPPTNGFNCDGIMVECTDKKRGLFYVTISKPVD